VILQCPDTTFHGIRHRALITLLYRTGLRHGEALALMPKDVNLEVGSVTVLHGKGDQSRTVGIDPGANWIIESWLWRRSIAGVGDDAPLFCMTSGAPMPYGVINMVMRRNAKRAGIEKRVHPHGLRHTHAYELMMEGIAMPIIQAQLGHKSLATTDRYLSHIAPRQVIEAIAKREWEP
ncbi:MAG: site-specific integrase, partial [Actinomycetota bacterium]